MKRLTKIDIAGATFKIKYIVDYEHFGSMHIDDRVIKVRKGMSDEETSRTIFHEAIHATFSMSGISYLWDNDFKQEEAVVRALDNIFFPVAKKILTAE